MSLPTLLFRFLLGATLVSLFAAIGSSFKPKSFAGIFGAAPPIALASLAIASHEHGPVHVQQLARSMALGALALACYSVTCVALLAIRGLPVMASAALAWGSWGLAATGLFYALGR